MAIEKTIELNVDSKGAQADFGKLADAIQELNKSFSKFSDTTEKGLDDITKSSKKTQKGVGLISKGFKGLGLAMKAAGIGLAISALAGLKDIFSQNQKVVDVFSTAFETFSIVANQVVTAVINVYEAIAKSSENFNGLGKVLGSLITIGITPLKLGFFAIKLALQTAQLAWENSFFGDKDPETIKRLNAEIKETSVNIAEVANDALDAGKDIATNIGDAIGEVANIGKIAGEELGKISVKAALETAKTNVQLKNSAEIAAAQQSRLVEQYDRQAEQLRQVRDEERNTVAERKEANDKLLEVLAEQETAMLKQADLQVAAAQNEVNKNNTIEAQVALIDALANKEGVLAQVEGLRSEQLSNDLALDREQIELTNSKLESESTLSIERKRFNAEQITDELARLEALKEIDLLEAEQETIRLQAIVDNANAETQAKIDAQIALDDFTEQSRQTNLTRDTELETAKKDLDQKTKDAKISNLEAVSGALNGLSALAGENAQAQKFIGIAQATIDTFIGANKALAQGGIAGPIAAAGIIATGIANVATIVKTKIPNSKGGGGAASGSAPSGGGGSQPPSFNIVGASDTNQLADAIGGQTQQPVQAFVVANDVTTAQSLQNNIVEGATIG
tara:strand:- start:151 stop:2019 length:1869 start_codon:yes stop_codon:yes gene_type:complete